MNPLTFFIGTYTQAEGHVPGGSGEGIYVCQLDLETGAIKLLHTAERILNPTYLSFDKRKGILYAASENCQEHGQVHSFKVGQDQQLTQISVAPTHGVASCHVMHAKRSLFVAAYADGLLDTYAVKKGEIKHVNTISYTGNGPNTARQKSSHAHQAVLSTDAKWLYVPDLGADKIWCHKLGDPLPDPHQATEVPAGYGPRHMVFHPRNPYAYIACELTGHLLVAKYTPQSGTLNILHDVNTLPPNFKGKPSSAAIRLHPNGKAIYMSNRQHNSFSAYGIDKKGNLQFMARLPSGGREPRDIQVDPSGSFLLCANQDDNNISVYRLDSKTGRPIPGIVQVFDCNTPVCIEF